MVFDRVSLDLVAVEQLCSEAMPFGEVLLGLRLRSLGVVAADGRDLLALPRVRVRLVDLLRGVGGHLGGDLLAGLRGGLVRGLAVWKGAEVGSGSVLTYLYYNSL